MADRTDHVVGSFGLLQVHWFFTRRCSCFLSMKFQHALSLILGRILHLQFDWGYQEQRNAVHGSCQFIDNKWTVHIDFECFLCEHYHRNPNTKWISKRHHSFPSRKFLYNMMDIFHLKVLLTVSLNFFPDFNPCC